MNVRLTLRVLGGLLMCLGGALLLPLPCAIAFRPPGRLFDGGFYALLIAAVVTAAAGYALFRRMPDKGEITHREAFGIVTFAWLGFSLFGALPYLFSGVLPNPFDAFFETMSGFTTTGASVIRDLSSVPKSILLWRALTQWLGGMGFIVLGVAILPFLGVNGMQLFEAEATGPTTDRLRPRIQDTAKVLWGLYLALTAVLTALLYAGGLSFFQAICHAFTTMASGGFSTENTSIAAFPNPFVHWVIILFMFLTATNYTLLYCVVSGHMGRLIKSNEFRLFGAIVVSAVAVIALINAAAYDKPLKNLTDAVFQVVSVMSTTGFVTADYEQWPYLNQLILLTLMLIGGCAGSTSGGLKVVRVGLLMRQTVLQLSNMIHPRQVRLTKLDGKPVPLDVLQGANIFVFAFIGVFLGASLLLTGLGIDLVTASTAVLSCMSDCGPALGTVGPTDNFAHLPGLAKLILSACMLVGRLEIFTVFVLFSHSFWHK